MWAESPAEEDEDEQEVPENMYVRGKQMTIPARKARRRYGVEKVLPLEGGGENEESAA